MSIANLTPQEIGTVLQYPTNLRLDCNRVVNMRWSMYKIRDMVFTLMASGFPETDERPLVRLQSYCSIGQTLGGAVCDCDDQLEMSKLEIANHPSGLLILNWSHEGRGAGLEQHFRAHVLHENKQIDSVQAYEELRLPVDPRTYENEVAILQHLGLNKIRLMTNNPKKSEALAADGFDVQRVPLVVPETKYNARQLAVRRDKLGHDLPISNNGNGNGHGSARHGILACLSQIIPSSWKNQK